MKEFGSDIMVMGEANEEIDLLNGIRVQAYDGKTGKIQTVLINRDTRQAQIWVDMDDSCVRCFRPQHLKPLIPLLPGQNRLLEEMT